MNAHRKMLGAAVVVAAAVGIVTATAASAPRSAWHHHPPFPTPPSITGFPSRINTVDLNGYVIDTTYPLGANAGNTFEQDYTDTTVDAHAIAGPDVSNPPTLFHSIYTAMPVGHDELMVAWFSNAGTSSGWTTDIFLMNFRTGIVSDVAPPSATPDSIGANKTLSLGTVKIVKYGPHPIP